MAAAQNLGLFGMLNSVYNVVGTACAAAETSMDALHDLSKVGKLKSSIYLREEELMGEEKLAVLEYKRTETLERLRLEAQKRASANVVAEA
jgi:hypothetical protein